MVSSPTFAFRRPISASRASAGRLFSDASPAARKASRQPLSSAAVTPSSRETSSRSSPRSSRSTASRLRPADIRRRGWARARLRQRGGRAPPGPRPPRPPRPSSTSSQSPNLQVGVSANCRPGEPREIRRYRAPAPHHGPLALRPAPLPGCARARGLRRVGADLRGRGPGRDGRPPARAGRRPSIGPGPACPRPRLRHRADRRLAAGAGRGQPRRGRRDARDAGQGRGPGRLPAARGGRHPGHGPACGVLRPRRRELWPTSTCRTCGRSTRKRRGSPPRRAPSSSSATTRTS